MDRSTAMIALNALLILVLAFAIAADQANAQQSRRLAKSAFPSSACKRVERFGKPHTINLQEQAVRLAEDGEPVLVPTNGVQVAGDELWDERFTPNGANDEVVALARDGSGNLYAGGYFTAIGTVAANHIAMWDGVDWHPLGVGTNDEVNAIAIGASGDVYVGGGFTAAGGLASPVNYIARWDGSNWHDLDGGVNNEVNTLHYDGSTLYAGGRFTLAGDPARAVNYVASWDGSIWSRLGTDTDYGTDGFVNTLVTDNSGALFVGGTFSYVANTTAASKVAKWDGSWSALGSGFNNAVNALVADGATVYAGGGFTTSGGTPVSYVASWNGTSWNPLAGELDYTVESLVIDSNGDLVAGGLFEEADGSPALSVAKWNGFGWSAMGAGAYPSVQALVAGESGELFAGGPFIEAGGAAANYIAHWTDTGWEGMAEGLGLYGQINAIARDGLGNIYVGGYFEAVGGVLAKNIAKWDGSAWSALGPGLSNTVEDIAVAPNGDVYVTGQFDQTGDFVIDLWWVGRWSGGQWYPLEDGLWDHGYALAVQEIAGDTYVFVGGEFEQVGLAPIPAKHLAMWDESQYEWSAVGEGVDGPVTALAIDTFGDLYVGGDFLTAGETSPITLSNAGRWDGNSWDDMDGGVNGPVLTLASDINGDVYAAGLFTMTGSGASTTPANYVAKWDGVGWSPLGTGLGDEVYALEKVPGGDLFAGGAFTTAGGGSASHIAKWSGGAWSAMGGGMDNDVLALGRGSLYAGGAFETAGNKPSSGFALWSGEILDVELVRFEALADGQTVRLEWETASERDNRGFEVQHKTGRSGEWKFAGFVPGQGGSGSNTYSHDMSDLEPGNHRFRLKQIDSDGSYTFSREVEFVIAAETAFALESPYPNPARSTSHLVLSVQTDQQVNVRLLDMLGRQIRTIFAGDLKAGFREQMQVNTSSLAPGPYLIRIEGERFTATQDLVVVR